MSGPAILTPPIDATLEIETICFDYGLLLQEGAPTIVSVGSMICSVIYGTDASASARLIGASAISASRETGASAAAVLQQVGNMVAGVIYLIQCVAVVSDGQHLSLTARLRCVQPI